MLILVPTKGKCVFAFFRFSFRKSADTNTHFSYTKPLPVIMTKTALKTLLLILTIMNISCKKDVETILETDYKVIELDYGFDNYNKNIRNKADRIIIKERNIVIIDVDKNGRILIENKIIEDSLIIPELKKYIIPNPENNEMPNTIEKEFE